jgi:chloride channel protein, CIC family
MDTGQGDGTRRPASGAPPRGADKSLLTLLRLDATPLDLRLLGRTLFHVAVVGAAAGAIGVAFFAGLEYMQRLLLEELAGYIPLRAPGEAFLAPTGPHPFRPWLLLLLPAVGGLLAGLVMRLAPETAGGGGDRMIHAFHNHGGVVRGRVIWVKALASILTLGSGGSGGREGPTMQIGAALGSLVGRLLRVTARERRILMVAGVAAGIAAVFRTPLGAALLAVEVLYRDDFESDALIPAVLASVVAYSVVVSVFGESTLFARTLHYTFHAKHLPLFALLAVLVALLAAGFVRLLKRVQQLSAKFPGPVWTRPAVGGLLLGILAVPVLMYVGEEIGQPGQGLGLLGGGYGAAQMAISGAAWLPGGWPAVELLLLLCGAKLVCSALTIGSGGSAGDFAPSLVLGGIAGGAFGRAAQLLIDPAIDPGAFALVGMGTFYGGIAHVPVSALILVSELAGSYDLLVPLMLSGGVAFVALRRHSLYEAQPLTKHQSPAHRQTLLPELVGRIRVAEVMTKDRPYVSFSLSTSTVEILDRLAEASWQDVFPVCDETGVLRGIIPADALRYLQTAHDGIAWTIAADLMQPPVSVRADDELRAATTLMLANNLRELPVIDADGRVIGFLDEAEAARAYVAATGTPPPIAVDG